MASSAIHHTAVFRVFYFLGFLAELRGVDAVGGKELQKPFTSFSIFRFEATKDISPDLLKTTSFGCGKRVPS